ncbi:hypothetical protein [Enterobacter roggenkampii]|uniref:hypothetical protein n=1 Tax=Enterobacter roggenkampii TaxID=1812935 RepID=UPI001C9ABB3D|nr:hypothetical protein [Enterobacter roggenkampii]MBY7249195.1 hypothetical protein [Enterobacter roggenkampii]
MSNIDKQWLQQKIADMEAARDEIPFGLDEDDSNTLAALRIALASLEAEAVAFVMADDLKDSSIISTPAYRDFGEAMERTVGDMVALYTAPPAPANAEPVAWLWSHRKHPSEVSLVRPEDDERAEGAHWSAWSCQALYAAPPAPVSLPDYPDVLPCPVMLEPGLRFGKGVPTKTMLGALLRRTEYHAELEAMTPEQRAEHDAGMKEFAAMLQGADGNSPVIPDGWVMVPVEPTMSQEFAGYRTLTDTGKMSRLMKTRLSNIYRAMIAAAPQQEVKNV